MTKVKFLIDVDLWPTDLYIKGIHILIKEYKPTKFEVPGPNHSQVFYCTRCKRPTYMYTNIQIDMCKAIFEGGIKIVV